jgi:integrase
MLQVRENVGRALTEDEESRLLHECGKSRGRSLYAAIVLALNTCMRYSEIRMLRWYQVDMVKRTITVGKSKTEAGDGRVIPINRRVRTVLEFWAEMFPERKPQHFLFPAEKYGASGNSFQPCVYAQDPTKPIGDWKEAWEGAKKRAGVQCRFHDLRHTGCTRMLERGVPFPGHKSGHSRGRRIQKNQATR